MAVVPILQKTVELIENIESPDHLKTLIAELITKEFGFRVAGIFDIEGDFVTNAKVVGSSAFLQKTQQIIGTKWSNIAYDSTTRENPFGQSILDRKPYITTDAGKFIIGSSSPRKDKYKKAALEASMRIYRVKTVGVFPCFYKGRLFSCFIVGHREDFTKSEIDSLNLIANQLAAYLAFSELANGLRKQNKVLRGLAKLASEIMSTDPREIAQKTETPDNQKSKFKKIYDTLTKSEKNYLKAIAQNKKPPKIDSNNLLNSGVLDKNGKLADTALRNFILNKEGLLISDSLTQKKETPDLEIDFNTGEIHKEGCRLSSLLTEKELQIVKYLLDHRFRITTREEIAKIIWADKYLDEYSDWAIAKAISRIRKKIDDKKPYRYFVTIKNKGFMFRTKA